MGRRRRLVIESFFSEHLKHDLWRPTGGEPLRATFEILASSGSKEKEGAVGGLHDRSTGLFPHTIATISNAIPVSGSGQTETCVAKS